MTIEKPIYTAHAVSRGKGRDGIVKSDDDCGLELHLGTPKSLGGAGDGNNPEQLFAMGYAACFLTSMQIAAGSMGRTHDARKAVVYTDVHMGKPEGQDGYALAVDIKVEGVDQDIIDEGHKMCPYSRMIGSGAVVNVTKV
ncbi:OsmC-like protein [Amylostereum chailletii]|nr:OsmC-like protein [Amylostereum chailletii]